jgi:O-antigen ligase
LINREAIDTWLERAILALVLGLLTFGTLAFGGVRPYDFVVLWWLILGAAALWIVRLWLAPAFRFLWPPLCWAIIPFVSYAVWRYSTADIEFIARQELIQIILGALLLLIIINNLYSQESTRALCLAIVFLGMVVAMYGIFQWLRSSTTVWGMSRPSEYFGRASGTFICPNHLSGFLEMVLPIGIALVVSGRVSPVTRVCLAYASIVIVFGIAGARSRAGWMAAGAALALMILILLRRKGQRWIALVLLAALSTSGYWLYSRTVASRVTEVELTGHGREIRLRLWEAALKIWKENPWYGVGPDHFDHRYRQYREAVDRTQTRPGRTHNDYINTLVDYGAVGLVLALMPLGFLLWTAVRCWPYVVRTGNDLGQKKSNRAAIVLGGGIGLVALAAHSFFDFNMHIPANAFLAVTLMGLIAVHIRFATERYWFTARWPLTIVATLAIAGSLFYLVPQALSRSREVALLRKADKVADGSAEKIALLQKAFAAEPKNFETAVAIGEQLRAVAWAGGSDNQARAAEAIEWFHRAIALNKWEVAARYRAGMCFDWLDKHDEARPYFAKALELDPNHWLSRGMMGWHELQMEHYTDAYDWLLKSRALRDSGNPFGEFYFYMVEKIIRENRRPFPPAQ